MLGKIKSTNYVHIEGWMVTDLKLKSRSLLIYAIIYGFSQGDSTDHCFRGSVDYLAEWIQSSRKRVEEILSDLVARGYITKTISKPTNIYSAVDPEIIKETLRKSQTEKISDNDENTLRKSPDNPEKISDNNINIIDNNKYTRDRELNNTISEVISYLNKTCNTPFKSSTTSTKKLIKSRIKEGFTLDDFKRVIDLKYNDWGVTPYKFSNGQMSNEFLRPSTLFGEKFESYVYEALARESSEGLYTSISTSINPNIIDIEF
mgnify:CR=1 FL=1